MVGAGDGLRQRAGARLSATRAAVAVCVAIMATCASGVASAESRLRVVAFGTSLTARGGWQGELEARLAERLARPVSVSTIARSGATSDWAVAALPDVAAAAPDAVLIEFHANDGALNRWITPSRSRANMDAILSTLRRARPDALLVVMAMNPVHGARGAIRPFMARYVAAHRAAAAAGGAVFLDHGPAWARRSTHGIGAAIPDGLHPTAEAARSVIVPGLVDLLAARLAAPVPATQKGVSE